MTKRTIRRLRLASATLLLLTSTSLPGCAVHVESTHPPQADRAGATRKISSLVEEYQTEAIAMGNGTASRETERFIRLIRPLVFTL